MYNGTAVYFLDMQNGISVPFLTGNLSTCMPRPDDTA